MFSCFHVFPPFFPLVFFFSFFSLPFPHPFSIFPLPFSHRFFFSLIFPVFLGFSFFFSLTRKDLNSLTILRRLCATKVNTCEPRSDTFAATSPSEIRATDFELGSELQAQASKRVDDHRCV